MDFAASVLERERARRGSQEVNCSMLDLRAGAGRPASWASERLLAGW